MERALANLVVCPTWHSVLALGSERESEATRWGVRELMLATVGETHALVVANGMLTREHVDSTAANGTIHAAAECGWK
jgi:hypothetical protein